MKHVSRGSGRSATAAAAYRAASRIQDERTGLTHDYTAKRGVISSFILAPSRAPDWARDSAQLWNRVEQSEKRKDARLARENIVALPYELNPEQNREWLHGFVEEHYVKRGMVAQVSIHGPDPKGDKRNTHAHILLTTRQVTRNGFKDKKPRNWNDKATLVQWREAFADHMNRALEQHGHKERVDHRSYRERGIDREATQHVGSAANEQERQNKETEIGKKNRLTKAFNRNLEAMKAEALRLQNEIEAERKKQTAKKKTNKAEQAALAAPEQATDEHDAKAQAAQNTAKRAPTKDDQTRSLRDQLQGRRAVRTALEARHLTERRALQNELTQFYRRSETEAALAAAQDRLCKAQGWWGRITGKAEKARAEVEALRGNLENISWREKERLDALDKAQHAERVERLGPTPEHDAKRDFHEAATPATQREETRTAPEPLRAQRPEPVPSAQLQHVPGVKRERGEAEHAQTREEIAAAIRQKFKDMHARRGRERGMGR